MIVLVPLFSPFAVVAVPKITLSVLHPLKYSKYIILETHYDRNSKVKCYVFLTLRTSCQLLCAITFSILIFTRSSTSKNNELVAISRFAVDYTKIQLKKSRNRRRSPRWREASSSCAQLKQHSSPTVDDPTASAHAALS
jgi:hypothetical protein